MFALRRESFPGENGDLMYKLLIVDDEVAIRMMMVDYFEDHFQVLSASCAQEALKLCESSRPDLVISDIQMPGMKGPELLSEISRLYPQIKTILMTAYNVEDYLHTASINGVGCIVPKTVPFNFKELLSLVNGLLSAEIFGLSRYMLEDYSSLCNYTITSSDQARDIREEVSERISEKFPDARDIKLLLDEIITNAIYHAPALPDGTEKYEEYRHVILDPTEYVILDCGYDSEKYGVSITDMQGRLEKQRILYLINRHLRGEGMLDDSGRGIHMSRLFADRMIINICPGRKTEVILMNYFSSLYRGYKPLYINEIQME